MKRIVVLLLSVLPSLVYANIALEPLLNKVTLRLHGEQWVTTKTALVNVGVNAAVSDRGIERIQNDVMQKLKQLSATADWHIISYDRQLDKSGLESVQMVAQARLQQEELASLRDKAKNLSKPGETYTIDNVQFQPSEDEIREAGVALRTNLYQQAKAEIDTLNKTYPEQKFYMHSIDFISYPPPVPMADGMLAKYAGAAEAPSPRLSVGNKQELQATVVLAAMPDQVAQRIQASTK